MSSESGVGNKQYAIGNRQKVLNEAYANRKMWNNALSDLISRLKVVNEEVKRFIVFIIKTISP